MANIFCRGAGKHRLAALCAKELADIVWLLFHAEELASVGWQLFVQRSLQTLFGYFFVQRSLQA